MRTATAVSGSSVQPLHIVVVVGVDDISAVAAWRNFVVAWDSYAVAVVYRQQVDTQHLLQNDCCCCCCCL